MSGYIRMLLWLLIYTALSAVLEVQQSETVCGVQTVPFFEIHLAGRRVDNERKFQLRIFEKSAQETVGNAKSLTFAGTVPTL